jgi:nucleoside-diphosphate-sugar epimerase
MKILIIGGTGYIGSKLFYDYRDEYQVDTLDLEWFGNNINSNNLILDFIKSSEEYLEQYDVIILLAGHSSVGMSGSMVSTNSNNVSNFCNILKKISNISKRKRIKFIYASSSSVYGSSHDILSCENNECFKPHNYYDLSKQVIDYYATINNDVEYYGLRFGTVNGWSPNVREDIMLNAMYKAAIISNEITCMNQSNYRPILDIQCLSSAIKRIIERGNMEKRGIYNLLSFNDTIGNIATAASTYLKCNLTYSDKPGNSTYSFSASSEKFEKAFNFKFIGSVESILSSLKTPPSEYILTNRSLTTIYNEVI